MSTPTLRLPARLAQRGPAAALRPAAVPLGGVCVLLVVVVVFQRFVVPGTTVSVALPAAYLVVATMAIRGHVIADTARTVLYAVAVAACMLVGLIAMAWTHVQLSISSLSLLVLLYLPCCLRVSSALRTRFPDFLGFFQRIMVLAAVVCIGQWAAQMLGWQFEDLLGWVPPQLRVAEMDFNLSYPIYPGSSIFKSNGIVFLEPSFCSQFLALAIIVEVLLGGRPWRLVLFAGALLSTFSGTGLMLLAFGFTVLAARRGGRWAVRAGTAVLVAVVAVAFTPAASGLADRYTETSAQGSSGHSRFVAPYEQVAAAVFADLPTLLVGRGAGSITRDTEFFNPRGVAANYPAAPKLLGEYGLPAALLFLAFLTHLLLVRVPSRTLGLAALLLYFVLSSALLQPVIVYAAWLFSGFFAGPPAPVVRTLSRAAE